MREPDRRGPDNSAVVALRMEELTGWVLDRVAKMPREHRFTIGDRLIATALDITTLLCEAARSMEGKMRSGRTEGSIVQLTDPRQDATHSGCP